MISSRPYNPKAQGIIERSHWHEKNLAGKVLLKCIMEENQILLLKLHIILIKPSLGCLL